MELIHTSPSKIEAIHSDGLFGEFLFFSNKEYVMSARSHVTYSIEVDENSIIDARGLYYHEDAAKLDKLTADFAARFDLSIDDAEEVIAERAQLSDFREFDADESWCVQYVTAQAAKILGFRGVKVRDEQGVAYMIDMMGRESELALVR